MNLPAIFAQVHANSYYSRSDGDIYSAINSAGDYLFKLIRRELRGFFIKFDTTTIVLTPGTQSYQMPADFSSLIYFGERLTAVENYHPLSHVSIQDALSTMQAQVGWGGYPDSTMYGSDSPYSFDGPYLKAITSGIPNAPQVFQVDITPQIQQTRMTMLAYIAKWLPITADGSVVMLPDDAQPALLSLASANALDMQDDSMANQYKARASTEIPVLLSAVRQTQVTATPQVRVFW